MFAAFRHMRWPSGRWLRRLTADDGIAAVTVVSTGAILFILATTLISVAVYNADQTHRQEARVKALHMADAGLNAYLYELRRNPNYASSNPVLGWTSLDDGRWYVEATPPSGSTPLRLRATGVIPSFASTRTVVATVRFPTYAEYMFLSDANINIGAGAVIYGKVRCNQTVDNQGVVTGKVESHVNVTGLLDSAHLQQGYITNAPLVDFNQVSADLATMRTKATADGTYFSALASPKLGYRITFSGANATIEQVTAESGTGVLTVTGATTRAIPASGIFFFDDHVWVRGTYTGSVTVGCSSDIKIPSDLQPSTTSSQFTCGLVAYGNVIVPTWYTSVPDNMTLYAAMLAQTGSVYGDLQDGIIKNNIYIVGSISQRAYGYFVRVSGSTVLAGFRTRSYNYDPRLSLYPPPNYPTLRDGSLNVDSWIEQ
jgi:type II secretory pathway pseudopilin PulG